MLLRLRALLRCTSKARKSLREPASMGARKRRESMGQRVALNRERSFTALDSAPACSVL